MKTTDLTQEEIDLVLRHRTKQIERNRRRKNRIHFLDIAKKYEEWLQENNSGSSLSTFTDEFGFDGLLTADIFRVVENIRRICEDCESLILSDSWMERLK